MAKRWAVWAAILVLVSTLAPASKTSPVAQAQPAPESWKAYDSVNFGYRVGYPEGWKVQVAFENPPGEQHIIRQRVAFRSAQQAKVEIDVWDRDPGLPMDQWFSQVEHITTTVEINAVISGQDAYLRVEEGACGVPTTYAAYVPYGDRVYKIAHPNSGDLASLAVYDGMLRSFALWAVDAAARSQVSLPDYLPLAPLTCGINLCPSTCWGECTFAAINEGCCGYHWVPDWRCAKECIGDQPGDFEGNCVWWGAYTRPDVGALASGNAENWADSVRSTGQLPIDRTPKVGDIVVHPGDSYNHVAYVVWVSEDGTRYVKSDMGWCGDCDPNPDAYDAHTVDADDEFIHCKGDPEIPTRDWQFVTDCPFGWTPSKGFAASDLKENPWWDFDPAVDPYLLSPMLEVPASEYLYVMVRILNHAVDTTGTIYFTTASSPGFDESKSVDFRVINDGIWHDYIVDMGSNPNWQGTVTGLRIAPVGNGNADGSYDDIGIERIRFLPVDTTPPELAFNVRPDGWEGPLTGDSNPRFRWDSASDDPEGWGMAGYYVAVDDWTPEGECTADWWAGNAVSFGLPMEIAEGEHVFAVTSQDLAGNANPSDTDLPGDAPYYAFTVDLSGPSAPEIVLSGPGCDGIQNNGWQNTCYDPAFSWSAEDELSDVKDYLLYWGDRSDGTPDTQTGDSALVPGTVAPVDGSASAYLHVVARDQLDNTSGRSTFALRYDGAAPSGELVIDGDATVATQLQVTVTVSAQDTGSGVADYRLSNDGVDWTEWQPWNGEPAGTLDVPWELPEVDDTEHTVYAQVRDRAGNESTVAADSIWLDLDAAPSLLGSLPLREEASDPALEAQPGDFGLLIDGGDRFVRTRAVMVEAWAPYVSQVRLSNDSTFLDDGWVPCGPAVPWTLSASGSQVRPRRVYAWFRDEQGLIYGPYIDEIFYDAARPRGGIVILDGDPPTLKLWAWDGVSGVEQMRVGTDPTLTGASWQPYAAALAWEGGDAVAYVQYSDAAGNISRIFTSDEGLCPAEHVYLPQVLRDATAPACVDVVANGDFESDSDWVLPSTDYQARYSTAQAHSGSRSMQVGIVDAAEDIYSYSSAQQEVTIPVGVGSASLSFWLYTLSDEAGLRVSQPAPALAPQDTLADDAQYVILYDESGARKTLLSALLDDRAWVEYGSFDLSDYEGQTVKLYFGVFNDRDPIGAPTGMYVDDVSLEVCPP